MKTYLSFGGGVNSVAMMILMIQEKQEFEAIFVDHGADWPETYEYFTKFQNWLKDNGHNLITVLKPDVEGFDNLYKYYWSKKFVPSFMARICTDKFKIRPIQKYVEKPCFMLIGIDNGEAKRAKISIKKGIENRFPLIEYEIDREGCKDIIRKTGLDVPMKSGCYICPFQKKNKWRELRIQHPDLFCKADKLEKRNMLYRASMGKKALSLCASGQTLRNVIDENQMMLFKDDEYPPCECGL